jgi:NADH-quinone oxidoreductase subunit A
LRTAEKWPCAPGLRLTLPEHGRKQIADRARHAAAKSCDAAPERSHPLDEMLREYLPILVFLAVAIGLGLVLILAAVVLAVRNPDPEKVSAYECGFNAFDDARMKFDVRFYLVSILFIIFDLEIAFLFPWAVAFQDVSMAGFWSMMVFLAVLTIGFAYEWKKGALEWQ